MRRMMVVIGLLIGCTMMVGGIWGCDRGSSKDSEGIKAEQEDFLRSQNWPDQALRVVSLAPNITEILFELGLGEGVVGVTRYCDWPPQVQDVPKIGGMLDPDYEAILALNPDVVVGVQDGSDHRLVRRLESAGVAYGFVKVDDIDSIGAGIEQLGQWFGIEERASRLREAFDDELSQTTREHSLDFREGNTALLVYDQQPIVAAGPGSFGDELLSRAGLKNVLGEQVSEYPILDMEQVLSLNPAIIIDVSIGPTEQEVQYFWERFSTLEAVSNKQVIHLDDPVMMRPGPRLAEALRYIVEAVERR